MDTISTLYVPSEQPDRTDTIITEKELKKLRKALAEFAKSLGDPDILNSQKQVNELLATHGFNGDEFVKRYTTTLK